MKRWALSRSWGVDLAAMDEEQFVPFQQPGLLGRAVGQDLLDEHLPALDRPGALVVGGGVDPLVQVERPQRQDQRERRW